MRYNFKMENGKMLPAFYNNLFIDESKNIYGHVSFYEGDKEYTRTVRKNPSGRHFFTWDKGKVYMDSFEAFTPEELVKAFSSGDEHVFGDDICHTLEKYGMDSLHMLIKVKKLDIISLGFFTIKVETSSSFDKEEDFAWIEYNFVDDYLRRPQDGYKLKVVPANKEEREIYLWEDFYVSDLAGLIGNRQDLYRLVIPEKKTNQEVSC